MSRSGIHVECEASKTTGLEDAGYNAVVQDKFDCRGLGALERKGISDTEVSSSPSGSSPVE